MPDKKEQISVELQDSLRDIVKSLEREDTEVRKRLVKFWKKCESFWHGMQYIYWNATQEGWMSPANEPQLDEDLRRELGDTYDYVVNIYRAHGEAIVSALSSQVPTVRFIPDNAEEQDDLDTAKAMSKVGDLIHRHNNGKKLFLNALFTLFNQPFVAAYHYLDSKPEYGTVPVPQFKTVEQKVGEDQTLCPNCMNARGLDEAACSLCDSQEPVETIQAPTEMVPQQVGTTDVPKSRAKIEIFGPLHVRVPSFAKDQRDAGYVMLNVDQHKAMIQSVYPDVEGIPDFDEGSPERTSRMPSQEGAAWTGEGRSLLTVQKCWLRPWVFYIETDEDKRNKLLEAFPKGCCVVFVGREKKFLEAYEDDLDERWTIGKVTLSRYIHGDPIGAPLVPLNEIKNQISNLTLDTIEHGIPSSFAEESVIDWRAYRESEARPGVLYPAHIPQGQNLSDKFFTEPRATLSKETSFLQASIERDAQFTVGAFPSIYGGPSEGKSRTLGEYAQSRQMALQRLSIIWSLLSYWWAEVIRKSAEMFTKAMMEDEKYTKREVNGSFVTIWVKRSELTGKIGQVEPEPSEDFPVSIAQRRALLIQLIEFKNDYLNAALYSPDNAPLLAESLAMPDFKIPNDIQRAKQLVEISELLTGESTQNPDGSTAPSVPIDPDVDNHEVHVIVLTDWLADLPGRETKRTNPKGYANELAHLQMHKKYLQMIAMQQATVQQGAQEDVSPTS